jgi:hypothetical protein
VYLQNYYEIMLYSYHCQCQSFGATESRSFETRRNNGLASAGAGGVGQASARFAALANCAFVEAIEFAADRHAVG